MSKFKDKESQCAWRRNWSTRMNDSKHALFKPTRQRIITRKEKKIVDREFSRKCALRDIHRFDPSVRLYVYVFLESVLSASCNTGGNKARKRFSVASWRCFNAMKTVSALQHEEKRTCLFQHVHFLVRTSRLAPKKFQQWN